jgi:leucyl aminopeptidase
VKLAVATGPVAELEADLLVVSASRKSPLEGAAQEVDRVTGGALSAALEDGAFKGALFESEWVYPAPNLKARRVLLIGSGTADQHDARAHRMVAGAAARMARKKGAKRVALALQPPTGMDSARAAELAADGVTCALSDSDLYKDRADKGQIEAVAIWTDADAGGVGDAIRRGEAIASAVNFARWLGDEPSNIMTPPRVAEEARKMAQANGIEYEVLDESQIRELGMGSLLSVSEGSKNPPQVVILRYSGADQSQPLGLVGKGVTFDTGGISIKPAESMHYMKYDMCGAAAVIAAVQALAQLRAKANVIAVAGLVENMPSDRATRPGDIVRAANGKTIEIINTDAEGRLVLADALHLAIQRGAKRLVDVATLTGAIKVALGDATTGVMGTPQDWVSAILAASERAGERLWQMPLYPDYKDKLKSNIADLMNTGGRFGGACIAAAFLQQFVGSTPWVHLDIAGTAWTEKDNPWQSKGATGVMIRTLVELAETQQTK